jgi:hypothetical protein
MRGSSPRMTTNAASCRLRVWDAVQREGLAERCTADPGPSRGRSLKVPGLQRTPSPCAAPGTRVEPFPGSIFVFAMDARVKPAHDDQRLGKCGTAARVL